MHSINFALALNSILHIQAPFCYYYAFHRSTCHSQQSLLRIWELLFWCFYSFPRPCYHSHKLLMLIQVPFYSFYALYKPRSFLKRESYWAFDLPMHSTVLLLIINSHHRLFKLDSSLFMHPSDLKRILHRHFFKFQCIAQTLLTLLTVSIEDLSSILLFLCVAQTLLSFSAVNVGHPSTILLFLCIS